MTRPNKKSLPQIASQIKALEKRTIKNAIEIGKLLEEAAEQCEHGEYMVRLENEFDFSHSTSLNYRNAYAFSQSRNGCDYAKWNISLGAFYRLAALDDDEKAARSAIIKAAQKGRVSLSNANDTIDGFDVLTPARPPKPPPPIEPLDDDDDEPTSPPEPDEKLPLSEGDQLTCTWLMHIWYNVSEKDRRWPAIIDHVGASKLLTIIATLQAIYDKYVESTARSELKVAADRAEAKAAMTAKVHEKVES